MSVFGLPWDVDESGLRQVRKFAREKQVGERVIGVRKPRGTTWKGTKTLLKTKGVPIAERASQSLPCYAVPRFPHSPLVARVVRRVRPN